MSIEGVAVRIKDVWLRILRIKACISIVYKIVKGVVLLFLLRYLVQVQLLFECATAVQHNCMHSQQKYLDQVKIVFCFYHFNNQNNFLAYVIT